MDFVISLVLPRVNVLTSFVVEFPTPPIIQADDNAVLLFFTPVIVYGWFSSKYFPVALDFTK